MATTQTFTKFYCFGPKPTAGTENKFTVRAGGNSKIGTCSILSGEQPVKQVAVSITINAGELFDVEVKQGNVAGADTWALAP